MIFYVRLHAGAVGPAVLLLLLLRLGLGILLCLRQAASLGEPGLSPWAAAADLWLPGIIILFATLPVADNFWLVYFLGMLAATALEYVVGA